MSAELLPAETALGHYRIISKIGAGGMGVVYKAYDTQLDRYVALKVLRPELLHDAEKVRRFAHEAKAASALNHPAIVTIYEVATADPGNIQYIAMEYVEGPSLRQYFHENVSLVKLLEIIAEVADGMAKAHSSGVVHRDLKPDNIVLTPEGQPKIVDFGLAKLLQADLLRPLQEEGAPTISLPHSTAGAILGTVGYMSPEQVEGRAVDQRSDVFSLGCILYEAVARRNPFQGDSVINTLHQILSAEPPPVTDINADAPQQIDRIVRRCLAKDPDRRYQSIKEIAIEIRQVLDGDEVAIRPARKHRTLAAVALAMVVVAIAIVPIDRTLPADLTNYRFTPFATEAAYEGFPAWSPDGKSIAYIADVDGILQVFVKGVDGAQPTQITHAVSDCREPFWDPRGNRIFYISLAQDRDSLWGAGVGGGEPEVLVKNVYTAAMAPDRRTLAMLRETSDQGNFALSLWTASPPEAEPKRYALPPERQSHFAAGFIRFSPDNRKIALWTSARSDRENEARELWIVPRDGARPYSVLRALLPAPRPYPFAWMPDSQRIVFGVDYLTASPGMHLWTADIVTGAVQPLTRTAANEYYPSVSPDGKRIIFSTQDDDFDLYRIPLNRSAPVPFLATSRTEKDPVWSPAKDEYAYITNRTGSQQIWIASGDGQWRRPVTTANDFATSQTYLLASLSFSPDGERIAYQRRGSRSYQIWISPAAGGPAVPLIDNVKQYNDAPTWSPNGKWIAYTFSDPLALHFGLAKVKPGSRSLPVVIKPTIVYPSNPHWSPRGDWITVDLPEGFSIVSPDGSRTRLLSERSWLAHTWAQDGASIYGIHMDDSLHLVVARIDVATGEESVISDLGLSPPMIDPVDGFSLARDGQSFLTSMAHLKGDLWMVEGYPEPKRSLLARLRSVF